MERLGHFVNAVLGIGEDVGLTDVLGNLVPAARELAGARYAALGVLSEEGEFLAEFLHDGLDEDTVVRIGKLPQGHGLLGLLITDPQPIRMRDLTEHPASYGFPEHHPPMRSFLGVPVRIGDRVFGNLYLTDKIDTDEFTAEDEDFTIALASVAGMVIENARLYDEARAKAASLERANREIERLAVIEDRERIGRELHDTIVQRIFSSGMTLQAVAQGCEDARPEVAKRINDVIDDLDQTIRQIRTAIFSLDATGDTSSDVRMSLLRVVAEASRLLDFEPELTIDGPVDTLVPHAVRDDAVSVLREALTNVVRHAEATSVWIRVVADTESLTLEITDDGIGPSEHASGGRGLLNMRQRANRRGGSLALRREEGRTVVWWRVPLP